MQNERREQQNLTYDENTLFHLRMEYKEDISTLNCEKVGFIDKFVGETNHD